MKLLLHIFFILASSILALSTLLIGNVNAAEPCYELEYRYNTIIVCEIGDKTITCITDDHGKECYEGRPGDIEVPDSGSGREEVISPISYVAIGIGVVLVVVSGVLLARRRAEYRQ